EGNRAWGEILMSDAKMLLEISSGARFWRLVLIFVVVSVLRNRDRA
ncbi:hypothetical protein A2U01_0097818, partial [Trifolium medium]|nr:hypothetical protein [Trifolium medium]